MIPQESYKRSSVNHWVIFERQVPENMKNRMLARNLINIPSTVVEHFICR